MKTHSFTRNPSRGSALLAALIVIVILTFAAAGVLSYSLTTYRNSVRQAILDQAKEIADSEMEYLYYSWKTQLLGGTSAVANISCINPTTLVPNSNSPLVLANICATDAVTPVPAFSTAETNWTIMRTVDYNPIAGTSDGSAQGIVPGTLQTGRNYYFSAYTVASIVNPVLGPITYHSGRHFVYSSTSLFQFAVFYQGNLEIAAGGNMVIQGPVSTNASAYLGSQPGYTLTIADTIYYFQDYNGMSDPYSGETDRLEGTGSLTDPVYNPNPLAAPPSNQVAQRADQVVKLSSQTSFIGGVDVANDIVEYPSAYINPNTLVVDPNEVYRAVIAPPPLDTFNNPIPEDPVVAASRMYNRAGLLITITQPTSGPTVVNVGTAANPSAYTTIFASALPSIVPSTRVLAVDKRELVDNTPNIEVSTLDVGQLNTALSTIIPANPTVQNGYNGLVYIYDNSNNSNLGVPNNLNAILLQNATTTPAYNDVNNNPLGFSVASNNGIFVQGDYNTTQITVDSTLINNPSAIMGDAVTAVSQAMVAGRIKPAHREPRRGLQRADLCERGQSREPGHTGRHDHQRGDPDRQHPLNAYHEQRRRPEPRAHGGGLVESPAHADPQRFARPTLRVRFFQGRLRRKLLSGHDQRQGLRPAGDPQHGLRRGLQGAFAQQHADDDQLCPRGFLLLVT
jgi:Tfp pilus assembly protein PilX